jgi:hypothetical protein
MRWFKEKAIGWCAVGAIMLFIVLVSAQVAAHALIAYTSVSSRSGLYAVFLSNGQVYFGNISTEDDRSLTLNNVYYIQTKGGQNADVPAVSTDVALVKLGNELHGPEDYMEINRSSVLFIEKLKQSGKVAQAINSYQTK